MKKTTLIILVILSSCTVTKEKIYKEKELKSIIDSVKQSSTKIIVDSVVVFKDRVITKPINTVIEVPIECDKDGKIKNLEYQVNSGKNKIKAILKHNTLLIEGIIDSTKNTTENTLKTRYTHQIDSLKQVITTLETRTTEKKVVEEPFFLWAHKWCVLVFLLLVLAFYKVLSK